MRTYIIIDINVRQVCGNRTVRAQFDEPLCGLSDSPDFPRGGVLTRDHTNVGLLYYILLYILYYIKVSFISI